MKREMFGFYESRFAKHPTRQQYSATLCLFCQKLVCLVFAFAAAAIPINTSAQVQNQVDSARAPQQGLTPNQLNLLRRGLELEAKSVETLQQGNLPGAIALTKQLLDIRTEVFGVKHPDTAKSLNNLGYLYYLNQDYANASDYYEKALNARKEIHGPKHIDVAESLHLLGTLYYTTGEYAVAKACLELSLKIQREVLGAKHLSTGESLNMLGAVLFAMADYVPARSRYEEALAIRREILGNKHPDTAQSLSNLGLLLSSIGDYPSAKRYLEEALTIAREAIGPKSLEVSTTLNNLSAVAAFQGDNTAAKNYCEQALAIDREILGPNHPELAKTLNNLGGYLTYLRDFSVARTRFEESMEIRKQALGPEHPLVATSLYNLGALCFAEGEYEVARANFERALEITKHSLGPNHFEFAKTLHHLSLVQSALKEWPDASLSQDEASRVLRRYIAQVLPALSAKEQLTFLRSVHEGQFQSSLSLGYLRSDDSQIASLSAGWLVNGKAVAQEALAQQLLLGRDISDPKSAQMVTDVLAIRQQLAALVYSSPEPGKESQLRKQMDELERREHELSRKLAEANGQAYQADPWVEIDSVRQAIPNDAIYLDFARFEIVDYRNERLDEKLRPARYAAWLIPPTGGAEIQIVDLGEAEPMDHAVQAVRDSMLEAIGSDDASGGIENQSEEKAEESIRRSLAKLSELLVKPIADRIGSTKQIILSPDALLWLIPWGALLLEDGRYVIEEYEIRYVLSGRDLVAPKLAGKTNAPIIMADPNYDLDSRATEAATKAVFRSAPRRSNTQLRSVGPKRSSTALPLALRLPGTLAEANAIQPRLAAYTQTEPIVYTDQYALEQVFKAVKRPKALVLSTHGFFLSDQDVHRSEPLGMSGEQSRGAVLTIDGQPVENPLLRCGLLLAGCNAIDPTSVENDQDDGVLTGMEIIGTDLRGTELVVLSACETGLGQVRNGEGVAGLRQAFQLAGAESIVATLWQIPDRDSVRLMSEFFTNLATGQSKSEALRHAQLQSIETRRQRYGAAHPFYWAAFTLTGN